VDYAIACGAQHPAIALIKGLLSFSIIFLFKRVYPGSVRLYERVNMLPVCDACGLSGFLNNAKIKPFEKPIPLVQMSYAS
jgi:hypothetical protein